MLTLVVVLVEKAGFSSRLSDSTECGKQKNAVEPTACLCSGGVDPIKVDAIRCCELEPSVVPEAMLYGDSLSMPPAII